MIEIDGYKIKQYECGYELHTPYDGYKKSGRSRVACTKHRVTYWHTLKHACIALLDTESGKCNTASIIIAKMDECTSRIISAIG
jgi:hypothetical protein